MCLLNSIIYAFILQIIFLPRLNIFIQLLLCHSLVLLISVSAIPKRTEPTRPPTLQGNMVSLRLSRQVDAPNQCSSANKSVYKLVRYWHTCIAPRVLRFATQFVTLLAAPTAPVRAATCVLHATIHFVLRYASLHHVRSFDIATRHCTLSSTQGNAQVLQMPFRKPSLQYSLGFISLHYVLHSFQSHSVHPLPIILACLAACHSCGFVMVFDQPHNSLTQIKTHAKPLHSQQLSTAVARLCSHHCGRRTQPIPFVPLSIGFLAARPSGYSVDKCATRLCFFLAAGAITFLPTHRKTLQNLHSVLKQSDYIC